MYLYVFLNKNLFYVFLTVKDIRETATNGLECTKERSCFIF